MTDAVGERPPMLSGARTRAAVETRHVAPSYPGLLWDDTRSVFAVPARWGKRDWVRVSGASALVVGSGLLLDPKAEGYVEDHNERPRVDDGHYAFRPFSGNKSFPSGHATEAFAVASVVAAHYDRFWVKALSYGIASVVGLARMDHAGHYVSDVVAGALIGTSVGKTVVHINAQERAPITFEPVVREDHMGMAATLSF